MYRQLNKEARAPLPAVHRAIRRYQRSASSAMSDFHFNQACIDILHKHNWRKGDYLRELNRRARTSRYLQYMMSKRPLVP